MPEPNAAEATVQVASAETSECELVVRLERGDLQAFELLMRRYNRRLFRIARAMLGNDAEAEDVVQETFVAVFTRIGQYSEKHPFGAWLTRIALNNAVSRLRRGTRTRAVYDLAGAAPDHESSTLASPEDAASLAEGRRALQRAIDALEPAHRTVLVMRDVEEMSGAAVAACLGISEAAVRVRLHRARERLRQQLAAASDRLSDCFQFGGVRCDRIVRGVLAQVIQPQPLRSPARRWLARCVSEARRLAAS